MVDYLGVIKSTIHKPDRVFRDTEDADRELCYSHGRLEDSPNEYMKVVIAYDDEGHGFVITAYPTTTIKAGEIQIWP